MDISKWHETGVPVQCSLWQLLDVRFGLVAKENVGRAKIFIQNASFIASWVQEPILGPLMGDPADEAQGRSEF